MAIPESASLLPVNRRNVVIDIDQAEKVDEGSLTKDLTVRVFLVFIAAVILYADRNQPTSTLSLTATSVIAGTGGKGALKKYTVPRIASYPVLAGIISMCMKYDDTNISAAVFLSIVCKDFVLAAKKAMKGTSLIDLAGIPNQIRRLFKCSINENQAATDAENDSDDEDETMNSSCCRQAVVISLIAAAMIASYFIPTPATSQNASNAGDSQIAKSGIITLPTILLTTALIKVVAVAARALPGEAQVAIVAAALSGGAVANFGFSDKLPVDLAGPLLAFSLCVVIKSLLNYMKGKKNKLKWNCGSLCKKAAKEEKQQTVTISVEGEGDCKKNITTNPSLFSEPMDQQEAWQGLYWGNPKLQGRVHLILEDDQLAVCCCSLRKGLNVTNYIFGKNKSTVDNKNPITACCDVLGEKGRNVIHFDYTCDKTKSKVNNKKHKKVSTKIKEELVVENAGQKKPKKKKTKVSNYRKIAIVFLTGLAAVASSTVQPKGSIVALAICGLVAQLFDKAYIKKNKSAKDLGKRGIVYGVTMGAAYAADTIFNQYLDLQTKAFATAGTVVLGLVAKKEGRNVVYLNCPCKKSQNTENNENPFFSKAAQEQVEWLKVLGNNPKLQDAMQLLLQQENKVAAYSCSLGEERIKISKKE